MNEQTELPALRLSGSIQGNILAGFKKDFQTFLVLQFTASEAAHGWLSWLLQRISWTNEVAAFNDRFRIDLRNVNAQRDALPGSVCIDPPGLDEIQVNVSFTAAGLIFLAPALEPDVIRFQAFAEGPAEPKRAILLGDVGASAPASWLFGGSGGLTIHALVTVAADTLDGLIAELDSQHAAAAYYHILTVFEQIGRTLPDPLRGHEHFGFKDAISQPGIEDFDDVEPGSIPPHVKGYPGRVIVKKGEFLMGYPGENGKTRLFFPWMVDGSFHVFRRLAQDVQAWQAKTAAIRNNLLGHDPADDVPELVVGAKMVGRWQSGTALAIHPEVEVPPICGLPVENGFDYSADPDGHKTPRFAHVRRMYPRSATMKEKEEHRLLRRGIPYGAPYDPNGVKANGADRERGLCFSAYMASIRNQFEFLQRRWVNNPHFPAFGDGQDPVCGHGAKPLRFQRAARPLRWLDFQRCVRTTGAIYGFAPARPTLEALANGES